MGKQKGRTTKGAAARVTAAAAAAGRGEAQDAIVGPEPPTDTVQGGEGQEEAVDRAEITVPHKKCLPGTATDATAAQLEKELHELGGFALDMEEQLLHDLQALLARRRQQKGQEAKLASMDMSPRECDGGSNDALYWNHMYERLKDLRETEAEKLSREVRQHAEQQSQAYKELVAHLKAQLEYRGGGAACQEKQQLVVTAVQQQQQQQHPDQQPDPHAQPQPRPPAQQLQQQEHQHQHKLLQEHRLDQRQPAQHSRLTLPATGSSELIEARSKIQCLEAKVARLKRQLLGYQRLTSLCLSVESEPVEKATAVEDSVTTLTCTAINHIHKRAVKFQVALNCDHEDILDLDAHFRPLANVNLLPDFLKQEVTLATEQCPLLALSILNMLFEDDGH